MEASWNVFERLEAVVEPSCAEKVDSGAEKVDSGEGGRGRAQRKGTKTGTGAEKVDLEGLLEPHKTS